MLFNMWWAEPLPDWEEMANTMNEPLDPEHPLYPDDGYVEETEEAKEEDNTESEHSEKVNNSEVANTMTNSDKEFRNSKIDLMIKELESLKNKEPKESSAIIFEHVRDTADILANFERNNI